MPTETYLVPTSEAEASFIEKRSEFIGLAFPFADKQTLESILTGVKNRFPDARHYCWAYRIGGPNSVKFLAFSDDGEPSGTAGKPILNVIEHSEIGDVLIVVVRYFGGVKLGAGGLVRAYSSSARQVMDAIACKKVVPLVHVQLQFDFSHESQLRRIFESYSDSGMAIEVDYQRMEINILCSQPCCDELTDYADAHQLDYTLL